MRSDNFNFNDDGRNTMAITNNSTNITGNILDNFSEEEESETIPQLRKNIDDEIARLREGPAFTAVRQNDIPILSALIFSGHDINSIDVNEDEGPKYYYYEISWHRLVRSIRLKDYTPLHLAVAHSKLKVVKYLLSNGADANVCDGNMMSPLSLAAAVQRPDVIKCLLNAGAIVNSQSVSGRTPLIQAINCNNYSILQQLLRAGADPNLADNKGTTPLLMCLQARRDNEYNIKILEALVNAGSEVDMPNKQGATALMCAVSMGRVDAVDLLLASGADINRRDKAGQTVMHLASGSSMALYLLQHGATSDWPDNKGTTPLDKAAKVGHLGLMNLYLQSDSKRTDAILTVPRVVQVREQIPLFDQWIQKEFGTPRTLKRFCRQTIRGSLSPSNTARIPSLPVPSIIKDFLLCKHLQLVFQLRHEQNSGTIPTLHP